MADYPAFLDRWLRLPLFASLSEAQRERIAADRLAHGRPRALARALAAMGTGAMPSLWDRLGELPAETHAVAGQLDVKYVALARAMGNPARVHVVPRSRPQPPCRGARPARVSSGSPALLMAHHFTDRPTVSGPFEWEPVGDFTDVVYEKGRPGTDTAGIARVTINRPEVRNAFRPTTVTELIATIDDARDDPSIGVYVITGAGDKAFCSGGDQRIRGEHGYKEIEGGKETGTQRLNVLDFQTRIRRMPKPVIAAVNGWAVGGGHVMHVVCDLTIASDNARFMQTGPKVGSFDAGYGTAHLARIVGQKKAREIWFLCRPYSAAEALEMGLVNTVVPLDKLEHETVQWSREILANSNIAIRMIKAAANADEDGGAGLQELAGHATMLFYMTEEGQEGRNAYLDRRPPNFDADGYRP